MEFVKYGWNRARKRDMDLGGLYRSSNKNNLKNGVKNENRSNTKTYR